MGWRLWDDRAGRRGLAKQDKKILSVYWLPYDACSSPRGEVAYKRANLRVFIKPNKHDSVDLHESIRVLMPTKITCTLYDTTQEDTLNGVSVRDPHATISFSCLVQLHSPSVNRTF